MLSAPVVAGGDTDDDLASAIGSEIQGNFQRFKTLAKRDEWAGKYKSRLLGTTALVESDGNHDGEATWYEWTGTKQDGSDGQWQRIPMPSGGSGSGGSAGIIIDDGTDNIAGVTTINVEGMEVEADPDSAAAVTLKTMINFESETPDGSLSQFGGKGNSIKLLPPLQAYPDPDDADTMRLEVAPGTYEPMKSPGMLVYLADTVEVIGKNQDVYKNHRGALWFDDVVTPSGAFLEADRINKSYGIQEFDGKDPNITGGQDFIVAFRVAFKGDAPNDGMVRIALIDKNDDSFIEDVNGHIMAVQRNYKQGDDLGHLMVLGVLRAKGLREFKCVAIDDFVDDILVLEDRTEGATGLMIQAISSEYKTGDALQQFELDTAQNIEFSGHYLGDKRASIEWVISQNIPVKEGQAGQGQTMNDGLHFYNISPVKMGVTDGHLLFEGNNIDICDFSFGKIFSAEETQMLRGHKIKVDVTLTDKDAGFNVGLMSWTGKPDEYDESIFKSRNNGSPIFEQGWSLIDTLFISEDAVNGDHNAVKDFTVPQDANNYAVIIYPVQAQIPLTLKLKQFDVHVVEPFMGYVIHAPELANELHLEKSDQYKTFVQDNQGFASLRYTINNAPTPMPVGELGKGSADITLDPSINKVNNSSAKGGEGAINFNTDGTATITTKINLYPGESVPAGQMRHVNFWYSTVGPDGSLNKIIDSELFTSVRAGELATVVTMPTFTITVQPGDRIALTAQADILDGAFIESVSPSRPMIDTRIDFKELVVTGEYDDPLSGLDLSQFDQTYDAALHAVKHVTGVSSAAIPIALPAGADLVVLDAVKKVGDTIRPVKNLDYSYHNNTLNVSFGEVADVKLTIGIYI